MSQGALTWFKNVSIKNKLYFIVGVMLFLIALELVTLYTMVYLLSAGRAYVGGESLWSKGEKDATIYLLKYANTHDESDYQKFLTSIDVTLGDKKARIELQKSHPDFNIAYQGFLEGKNQPDDIARMIRIFNLFQYQSHLEKAATYWIEADQLIPKLLALGATLHQEIQNNTLTPTEQNKLLDDIYNLNFQLTIIAQNFSYALGDASRWLEHVVLRTVLTIAIIVELSGLLFTILVTFDIRRGIDEIIRVAKKITRLDFTERAKRLSNDEIGQLATSFNQMTTYLEKSIDRQNIEIAERIKQEKLLNIRYEITRIMIEGSDFKKVIPNIFKIICEENQFQYGGLWQIDRNNNLIYCTFVWTTDDLKIKKFAEESRELIFKEGSMLPGKAWETKKPYIINDFALEPNFTRINLTKKAGLQSGIALPIIIEDKVYSIVEFFTDQVHSISINQQLMTMLQDVCNIIGIFIQREHAQKHVVSLSRIAGMAEVASNVLHNVGNTLTSINTSVILMEERNSQSKVTSMIKLNELFQQHKEDIANFLANDAKGKSIPQFLSLLSNEWVNENQFFQNELHSLIKNVSHIKNIIMIQQSMSRAAKMVEEILLPEMIDEAIAVHKQLFQHTNIKIERNYKPIKRIVINKDKLYQIIINLIKNDIEALMESEQIEKKLSIIVKEKDHSSFMIQFIDNGIGISKENISKLFQHGFTTKKAGHGFGLHNSAAFAQELGGTLSAESKGPGLGATFTLILPYKPT